MPFLAGIAGFARTVQGAIILALVAALVALSLYVWGFNIGPIGFDGISDKLEDCRTARKAAEDAAKQQKVITRDRIKTVREDRKIADDKARVVENAPLPGNCQTPRAILESPDL
jgi:hypothetical protein